MSSTTITRSWLSAVECRRSIASVAVLTAVSNPKVRWVPHDVVVDGLRDADDGQPLEPELVGDLETAVTADGDQRVEPTRLEGVDQVVRAVGLVLAALRILHHVAEGVAPVGGAENRPAEVGDAAYRRGTEGNDAVVGRGVPRSRAGCRSFSTRGGVRTEPPRESPRSARGRRRRRSKSRFSFQPPDQLEHLTRLSMSPELPLGEDQISVHLHLEDAPRRRRQLDLRVGKFALELGRQTGGPWLVVSDYAVFDRDLHRPLMWVGGGTAANRSDGTGGCQGYLTPVVTALLVRWTPRPYL